MESQTIDIQKLEKGANVMRALAHPLRLKIIEFIDQNESINVNKIYNTLRLEQSITSQHLRILRNAGIVKTEREGKFVHYTINYDKVDCIMNSVNTFLEKVKLEKN